MTVNAVFRMQCDGPCHGWLSIPTDFYADTLVIEQTSERAALYPGERAARNAAQSAGWSVTTRHGAAPRCLCPACKVNPLGIKLPPPGLERFV